MAAVGSSSSQRNNVSIEPNVAHFIPDMSHCMFSGHEKYLTMNRGTGWTEMQAGPGTLTPMCKNMCAFAQVRIVTQQGPSGTTSDPHRGLLLQGGGD